MVICVLFSKESTRINIAITPSMLSLQYDDGQKASHFSQTNNFWVKTSQVTPPFILYKPELFAGAQQISHTPGEISDTYSELLLARAQPHTRQKSCLWTITGHLSANRLLNSWTKARLQIALQPVLTLCISRHAGNATSEQDKNYDLVITLYLAKY